MKNFIKLLTVAIIIVALTVSTILFGSFVNSYKTMVAKSTEPQIVYQDKIVYQDREVEKEVPVEVPVEVEKIVEVEVPGETIIIEKEVPVEIIVEKEVEVIKEVEVPVEIEVERVIEIEKIVEVEVPVEVEKIVEIEVEKIVEVPVEVEKIVEVEVPIEVEKIVEVEKEVEKIVEVEVPVQRTYTYISSQKEAEALEIGETLNDLVIGLTCNDGEFFFLGENDKDGFIGSGQAKVFNDSTKYQWIRLQASTNVIGIGTKRVQLQLVFEDDYELLGLPTRSGNNKPYVRYTGVAVINGVVSNIEHDINGYETVITLTVSKVESATYAALNA